jgi:hypothetical protein
MGHSALLLERPGDLEDALRGGSLRRAASSRLSAPIHPSPAIAFVMAVPQLLGSCGMDAE